MMSLVNRSIVKIGILATLVVLVVFGVSLAYQAGFNEATSKVYTRGVSDNVQTDDRIGAPSEDTQLEVVGTAFQENKVVNREVQAISSDPGLSPTLRVAVDDWVSSKGKSGDPVTKVVIEGRVHVVTRQHLSTLYPDLVFYGKPWADYRDYTQWELRTPLEGVHNTITNAGQDYVASVLNNNGSTTWGGPPATLNSSISSPTYMALSNTGAVGDSAKICSGEITTNAMNREQTETVAHTKGATTLTLVNTWTSTGAETVSKSCLAPHLETPGAAADVVYFEATFGSATLANNDQLQLTWTITLSGT